eukprot:1358305-Rhodomonas_salina.2
MLDQHRAFMVTLSFILHRNTPLLPVRLADTWACLRTAASLAVRRASVSSEHFPGTDITALSNGLHAWWEAGRYPDGGIVCPLSASASIAFRRHRAGKYCHRGS